jgi:hypothetical protein
MAVDRTSLTSEAADSIFDGMGGREALGLDNPQDDVLDRELDDQGDQQDDQRGDQGDQQDDQGLDDLGLGDQSGHLPRQAEVKPDRQGNLRDARGNLVARAGADARRYMDLHHTRQRLTHTEAAVQDLGTKLSRAIQVGRSLQAELQTLQGQTNAVKQFGLEPAEHLRALELYKQLKEKPEDTLKTLLTRAAARGINLTNLGASGGVDAKSLVDMVRQVIDEQMKPIKDRTAQEAQRQQQQEQQTAVQQRANEEINTFFGDPANAEAKKYLPVFENLLQHPFWSKKSLGEIWANIQLQLLKNPPRRSNTNSRNTRSLPSGRGAPMNGGGDDELAPVSSSYDSILREVMDRAGIR